MPPMDKNAIERKIVISFFQLMDDSKIRILYEVLKFTLNFNGSAELFQRFDLGRACISFKLEFTKQWF